VDFDDLTPDEDKPRDLWRLGHRRPWWQWNVITLFVALFVLVWVRELARLPQTASWIICVGILTAWGFGPLLALEPRSESWVDLDPKRTDSPKTGAWRMFAFAAAIAMFIGVFVLGGLFVCVLALLGALLFAVAGSTRDE
jgi:hypothetical protein